MNVLMLSNRLGSTIVWLLMLCLTSLFAVSPVRAGQEDLTAKLEKTLQKLLPDTKISKVNPSPLPGLYEVLIGAKIFYMTEDGRYFLHGEILDIEKKENLTELRRNDIRKNLLSELKEEDMIVFAPKTVKYAVTVFTDIDCGYCRKFHQGMNEMQERGIKVRYLFFPRAGLDSDSYQKAVSVWCSDNRQEAMTKAKSGQELAKKTCTNPIAKHLELVESLGLRGTPALLLEDGQILPGYLPPNELEEVLKTSANPNKS